MYAPPPSPPASPGRLAKVRAYFAAHQPRSGKQDGLVISAVSHALKLPYRDTKAVVLALERQGVLRHTRDGKLYRYHLVGDPHQ